MEEAEYDEYGGYRFARWKPYVVPAYEISPSIPTMLKGMAMNLAAGLLFGSCYSLAWTLFSLRRNDAPSAWALAPTVAAFYLAYNLHFVKKIKGQWAPPFHLFAPSGKGASAWLKRLLFTDIAVDQCDSFQMEQPDAKAVLVRCSLSPIPGWLFRDKNRLCFENERCSFGLKRSDFRFDEDPDVEWFSGRISTFCLPKPLPVEAIVFTPVGSVRWGQTKAQSDLLSMLDQMLLCRDSETKSVFPPPTPDPMLARPAIPIRKALVPLGLLSIFTLFSIWLLTLSLGSIPLVVWSVLFALVLLVAVLQNLVQPKLDAKVAKRKVAKWQSATQLIAHGGEWGGR